MDTELPDGPSKTQDLESWLQHHWRRIVIPVVIFIASVILWASTIFKNVGDRLHLETVDARQILFFLQALTILLLIFFYNVFNRPSKKGIFQESEKAVERVYDRLQVVWVSWLALYLLLWAGAIQEGSAARDHTSLLRREYFELLSSINDSCRACVVQTHTLADSIGRTHIERQESIEWARKHFDVIPLNKIILSLAAESNVRSGYILSEIQYTQRQHHLWSVFANLLNNLQTFGFLWCFSALARVPSPTVIRRKNRAVVFVSIVLLLLFYDVILLWILMNVVWLPPSWWGGLLAGASMALVIGRLESMFIRPMPWVIGILYMYAVMQAGWGAFQSSPQVELFLTTMALFMKVLFYVFMAWLFDSGRLLYYFERVRRESST